MQRRPRYPDAVRPRTGILLLSLVVGTSSAQEVPESDAPLRGHLVICGGGKLGVGVRTRFLDLAGGSEAKLIVIPTASRHAEDDDAETYYTENWNKLGATDVSLVHVRERDRGELEAAAQKIGKATGVWISGGDQRRLTAAYGDTAVLTALHELLDRGGVVGGTSAGAACMSGVMIEGGREEAEIGEGFDLYPGIVVDQHFRQRKRFGRLRGVIRDRPHLVGIGIDEGTALEVHGRRGTVLGRDMVTVYLAAGGGREESRTELRSSNTVDLVQLRRAARARNEPPEFRPFGPVAGTVVLGGGGTVPDDAYLEFVAAAGGAKARVLVVTTACANPDRDGLKTLEAIRRMKPASVEIAAWQTADAVTIEDLSSASGVWFLGDRPWQVIDAFEPEESTAALRDVLARGGAVGGTQATVTCLGSALLRGHPLDDAILFAEGYEHGLGLLPGFAIEPHCSQRNLGKALAGAVSADRAMFAVGIDEDTAAVIHGASLRVRGKGKVLVYQWSATRHKPLRAVCRRKNDFDFVEWKMR